MGERVIARRYWAVVDLLGHLWYHLSGNARAFRLWSQQTAEYREGKADTIIADYANRDKADGVRFLGSSWTLRHCGRPLWRLAIVGTYKQKLGCRVHGVGGWESEPRQVCACPDCQYVYHPGYTIGD